MQKHFYYTVFLTYSSVRVAFLSLFRQTAAVKKLINVIKSYLFEGRNRNLI